MDIKPKQLFFIGAGWVSLALGLIGSLLPILPTTPFIILAAFCFSKGSPKWHQWLRANKRFGGMLNDWENGGRIRKKAKLSATLLIIPVFTFSIVFVVTAPALQLTLFVVATALLSFIWTRPSEPVEVKVESPSP